MNTYCIIVYLNRLQKKKNYYIYNRRMHVESKGKQINYIYYRLSQLIIESLQ